MTLTEPKPAPDLALFVRRHRRLPALGDPVPPWEYRGWLLEYVIGLHAVVPEVNDRWGYHLRTLEAGKLLPEPIPRLEFTAPDHKVFDLLRRWAGLIGWDCGGWSDFRTLLDWLLWGLSLSREMPDLTPQVHEALYRAVDLTPILRTPWDYLGDHIASNKARGWNPTAFYPTPHPVVECMVALATHDAGSDGRDPRTLTVCDPCAGTGRMLLHASNLSLRLYGQDIDRLVVAACLINGALYAPWMSFPIPDSFFPGSPGREVAAPPPPPRWGAGRGVSP